MFSLPGPPNAHQHHLAATFGQGHQRVAVVHGPSENPCVTGPQKPCRHEYGAGCMPDRYRACKTRVYGRRKTITLSVTVAISPSGPTAQHRIIRSRLGGGAGSISAAT